MFRIQVASGGSRVSEAAVEVLVLKVQEWRANGCENKDLVHVEHAEVMAAVPVPQLALTWYGPSMWTMATRWCDGEVIKEHGLAIPFMATMCTGCQCTSNVSVTAKSARQVMVTV